MLQSTPIRFACYKPMELEVGGATRVAPPKCVAPPQSSRLHSGVLGINGAKLSTIDAWQCFSSNICDYIKE